MSYPQILSDLSSSSCKLKLVSELQWFFLISDERGALDAPILKDKTGV